MQLKEEKFKQTFKSGLKVTTAFFAGLLIMQAFHTSFSDDTSPSEQHIIKSDVEADIPNDILAVETTDTASAPDVVKLLNLTVPPSQVGSYLAGRSAQAHYDWDNAFLYYNRAYALDQIKTTADVNLTERAFLTALISGHFEQAELLADQIIKAGGGELAHIVKAVSNARSGDFSSAMSQLSQINTQDFGGFAVPMLEAWSATAMGEKDKAFEILSTSDFSADVTYIMQTALVLDYFNDERAGDYYRAALGKGTDLRETLLIANYFERIGNINMAKQLYNLIEKREPGNLYTNNALERIESRQVPAKAVNDPARGFGYTLFTMSRLLMEKNAHDSALIYGRIAENIGYKGEELDILMGNLHLHYKDFDQALSYFEAVQEDDLLYKTSQLQKLQTWKTAQDLTSALALLDTWQQNKNYKIEALMHKGDLYSQQKNYTLARNAYDEAIQTLSEQGKELDWRLFYARAVMNDHLDNWPAAEADLKQALKQSPNNPQILNFLGYSWIDRGIHLEQSMQMIEKAITIAPYDSYILDSYGWAFYKLGDYAEAVKWLERAIEITPGDVTMNDHLGDAYWRLNRKQEAIYQWRRALGLSHTEQEKEALTAKIENGLIIANPSSKTDAANAQTPTTGNTLQ